MTRFTGFLQEIVGAVLTAQRKSKSTLLKIAIKDTLYRNIDKSMIRLTITVYKENRLATFVSTA